MKRGGGARILLFVNFSGFSRKRHVLEWEGEALVGTSF